MSCPPSWTWLKSDYTPRTISPPSSLHSPTKRPFAVRRALFCVLGPVRSAEGVGGCRTRRGTEGSRRRKGESRNGPSRRKTNKEFISRILVLWQIFLCVNVAVSIVYTEINLQLWNSTTKLSMFLNVRKEMRNNRKLLRLFVDSALTDVIIINLRLLVPFTWSTEFCQHQIKRRHERFVNSKTSLVASDAFSTCRLHACAPLFSLSHRKCLLGSTSKRLWDLRPHRLRFCPCRPVLPFVAPVRSFSLYAYYTYTRVSGYSVNAVRSIHHSALLSTI